MTTENTDTIPRGLTTGHKVLTSEGWKCIEEITIDTDIALWHKGVITFGKPTHVQTVKYSSVKSLYNELYDYHVRGYAQQFTPTLCMPTIHATGKIEFVTSEQLVNDVTSVVSLANTGVYATGKYLRDDVDVKECSNRIKMLIAANGIGRLKASIDGSPVMRFKATQSQNQLSYLTNLCLESDWIEDRPGKKPTTVRRLIPSELTKVDMSSLNWLNPCHYTAEVLTEMLVNFAWWSPANTIYKSRSKDDAIKVLTMLHLVGRTGYIVEKRLSYIIRECHRDRKVFANKVDKSYITPDDAVTASLSDSIQRYVTVCRVRADDTLITSLTVPTQGYMVMYRDCISVACSSSVTST